MDVFEQLVTSFIASAAFGVLFHVPKRSLLLCGFVGMAGWLIYYELEHKGIDMIPATVAAASFVSIISQIIAKKYKIPIIVFTVSGIIPLVPGGMAYHAMRRFVENYYIEAISIAAKAFMVSGAIAIGLIVSEVINQMIRKSKLVSRGKG
ncbi:threonine/serine exporter family protein [Bacillus sp. 03113]|uniref:threonine/serine exporter family protein n=1 Tax=Bacillus sp. 03113 TaxID=2578211 RepID=UPI00114440D8|nr:threonine/serine exporter family protein [Bacillus sp. 03113]